MLVGRRRRSLTEHMRQIFERNDVVIVGAAGQEGAERCPIVFVDNGAGVRFRSAVLPQDRQDVGAGIRTWLHAGRTHANRDHLPAIGCGQYRERGTRERVSVTYTHPEIRSGDTQVIP